MQRSVGVEQVEGEVMRELERRFPPEFRNRIDEVVLFAPLTHDEVREIARHYLAAGRRPTLAKAGKTITIDDDALELVVAQGLQHGVRRAVPEALHRRAHQAADQRAVEGRLALRRRRPGTADASVEPACRRAILVGRRRAIAYRFDVREGDCVSPQVEAATLRSAA